MSFASTFISCLIGMPLGVLLGSRNFRSKRFLMRLTHTLMGLPPVVAGLVVFMMLSRKGPLGSMGLLFSVPAMIIAQVALITPIVVGLTASHVSARGPLMLETARGMGIRGIRELGLLLYECKAQLVSEHTVQNAGDDDGHHAGDQQGEFRVCRRIGNNPFIDSLCGQFRRAQHARGRP